MEDKFSQHITQLKNRYKCTKFKPIFLNGCLEESNTNNIFEINVFHLLPDTMTPNFKKAILKNLENDKITEIYLITNNIDSQQERINHDKVKYLNFSKFYGIQFYDIFQYFKNDAINIFLYDSVVLDNLSIIFLNNLQEKQIGLISSRKFLNELNNDRECCLSITKQNESHNFEFNGFIVNGKINELYDIYVNIYGSLNLLIQQMIIKNYSFINLSNIFKSYIFEYSPYNVLNKNNYFMNSFPIIYVTQQLYFHDYLDVTLPDIESFEKYNEQALECIDYEILNKPLDFLSVEDQVIINETKNKIFSNFYLEYKNHFLQKTSDYEKKYNSEFLSKQELINKELELYKNNKELEINKQLQLDKNNKELEINKQLQLDKEENNKILDNYKQERINEIEELKNKQVLEIQTLTNQKLNDELAIINKNLKNTEQSAYDKFKEELELFTKKSYENLNFQINIEKQEKLKDIDEKIENLRKNNLHSVNIEHLKERERLEKLLTEYENYKKQEIDKKSNEDYFSIYSSKLNEIELKMLEIKNEKIALMDEEINTIKSEKIKLLNQNEGYEMNKLEENIKKYKEEWEKKVDSYIDNLKNEKAKTAELEFDIEFSKIKKKTIEVMEEKESSRINKETSEYKTKLIADINTELEIYKNNKLELINIDINSQMHIYYEERKKITDEELLSEKSKLQIKQLKTFEKDYNEKMTALEEDIKKRKNDSDNDILILKEKKLEEISEILQRYKDNNIKTIEIEKSNLLDSINRENDKIKDKLKEERELFHLNEIEQIKKSLIEEKSKINSELESKFKLKLEEEYKHKLQANITKIETEYETNISNLLNRYDYKEKQYIEKFNSLKLDLEKSVIADHNKQIKLLEEQLNTKIELHKQFLKDTVKEERDKLLLDERESIKDQLKEFNETCLKEEEIKIKKEIEQIRQSRLFMVDLEVGKIKEEKLSLLNIELAKHKADEQEKIKKIYKNLFE
jgi:hypothetical protein